MTHFAVIRRSGRAVPVTVAGCEMLHETPLTSHECALRAMGPPHGHVRIFSRKDPRVTLMPRD